MKNRVHFNSVLYLIKKKGNKKMKNKELINRVIEGDTLEEMKKIEDKSIDLILVDLPYGTTRNKWDIIIPFEDLWKEYNRVIKDNGAMLFTATGIFSSLLMLSNVKDYKYKLIWVKSKSTNFLNVKKQPLRKFEEILVFYKKQPTYNPQKTIDVPYNKGPRKSQLTGSYANFSSVVNKSEGERNPTDVLYFKTAETEGEVFHPTQKPVELGSYLIKTFTNKGDVVLDNTSGSGSFLVDAIKEGRNFIGIEKNEHTELFKGSKIDYIKKSEERIKLAYDSLSEEDKKHIVKEGLFKENISN